MKKGDLFMMVLCLWTLLPFTTQPLAALQSRNDETMLKINPDTDVVLLVRKGTGKDPAGWEKRKAAGRGNAENEILDKREGWKKRAGQWLKQEDRWRKKREQIRNRIEKIEQDEIKLKGEKEKLRKELETS